MSAFVSGHALLRSLVIGLIGFFTLVDLFAAQAILPTRVKAYGVDGGRTIIVIRSEKYRSHLDSIATRHRFKTERPFVRLENSGSGECLQSARDQSCVASQLLAGSTAAAPCFNPTEARVHRMERAVTSAAIAAIHEATTRRAIVIHGACQRVRTDSTAATRNTRAKFAAISPPAIA